MWRRIQWGLFLMLWNCCRYSLKTLLWLVGKSCSLSVKSLEWKILIFVPTINVLERKLLAPSSYWDAPYLYKGKRVQFSWVWTEHMTNCSPYHVTRYYLLKKKKKSNKILVTCFSLIYSRMELPWGWGGACIYISIKNILFSLKLIYLAPPPPKILQADPWNQKWKKKHYQIIPCLVIPRISRKTFN